MNAQVNIQETGAISASNVAAFRERAHNNGYRPIRVRSQSKGPLARDWQAGEPLEVLKDVRQDALNTGLILAGLRCIDIDVEDPALVLRILEEARLHLPGGALIRGRDNSPRRSLFYRAAEGQPTKREISGPKGKIEALGAGQQAVVHGQHPSGARLWWSQGRGPDTVPVSDLPMVTECQIDFFLCACSPVLGSKETSPNLATLRSRFFEPGFSGPISPVFAGRKSDISIESDLAAGIRRSTWFADLKPEARTDLLRACLNALDNRVSDPRERWLRVLFACADAERLGCLDARQQALAWPQRGASWTNERDFDTAWNSFKPEVGGTTIGSLLSMAREAGLDLTRWRDLGLAESTRATWNESGESSSSGSPPVGDADPLAFSCLAETEAVRRINTEYFVLRSTGQIYRQGSGDLTALSIANFKTAMGGRMVEAVGPNGTVLRPAANTWLNSPHRREFTGMQYCPNGIGLKPKHLNLFTGWGGITPAAGNCSIILDHIYGIVANGDKVKGDFLLNWLADILQHPTRKPGVCVALRGSEGTGKSVVGAIMRRLLGAKNVLTTGDKDRILGGFNAAVASKILLIGEEIFFVRDHPTTDKLKHLITGQTIQIEVKFSEPIEIGSYHRLLLTSNHQHVFQAAGEERRFVIYDVADAKHGDHDYFDALYALANGYDDATAAAFMQHLLDRDLSTFRPWKAQQTLAADDAALARQKVLSLSSPLAWLHEVVNGCVGEVGSTESVSWYGGVPTCGTSCKWAPKFRRREAVAAFRDWTEKAKPYGASEFTGSELKFWAELYKVIPKAKTRSKDSEGHRLVTIPLDELRANFAKLLKGQPV